MALITEFKEAEPGRRRLDPTTVTCEWAVFPSGRGTVVQLVTGGSDARQHPGKASQKVQLDREGAEHLLGLLLTAFPDLARDRGGS